MTITADNIQTLTLAEACKPGWCGFITRESDFVGDGIEWFSRWSAGIPFCHAFCVTGPDQVIEAHAGKGVSRATVSQYLGSKTCQCFVRRPVFWCPEAGDDIVEGMVQQLGDKYSFGLILADALANTYAGHLLNSWTKNIPDRIVCKWFTDAHHRICSQAVACALQGAGMHMGCLGEDAAMITPAALGNDSDVFGSIYYRVLNN